MDGKEHGSHKVLIIGGGFTGVMAAVELEKLGVDYRLLEAHPDRLGGRAYSYAYMPHTKAPGGPVFEHGAQYIGHDQSEIWALANEYVKTSIVDGCAARAAYTDEVTVLAGKRYLYGLGDCLFGVDGLPPNIGVWNLLAALLLISEIQMMEQSVDVVEPWKSPEWVQALDAITVADWTGRAWIPDVTRDLVSMATQALLSVDPQEISALYFFWYCACNGGFLNEVNDAEDGPQQYYLSCGMDALVDANSSLGLVGLVADIVLGVGDGSGGVEVAVGGANASTNAVGFVAPTIPGSTAGPLTPSDASLGGTPPLSVLPGSLNPGSEQFLDTPATASSQGPLRCVLKAGPQRKGDCRSSNTAVAVVISVVAVLGLGAAELVSRRRRRASSEAVS